MKSSCDSTPFVLDAVPPKQEGPLRETLVQDGPKGETAGPLRETLAQGGPKGGNEGPISENLSQNGPKEGPISETLTQDGPKGKTARPLRETLVQDGPKGENDGTLSENLSQYGPKEGPLRETPAQDGPKRENEGPLSENLSQDGPKGKNDGPLSENLSQYGPKKEPLRETLAQVGLKKETEGSLSENLSQDGPKKGPLCEPLAQDGPKGENERPLSKNLSQDGPKEGNLSKTLAQDGPKGENDGPLSENLSQDGPKEGNLGKTLTQDGPKGQTEGPLSENLAQDGPKGETDTAMSHTSPINQNNLHQLRQRILKKRTSKRRIYTGDDTNVPCSLLSLKDQKRISQWQKSRLRFDELVKKSLENQSNVKDGDQFQDDRNITQTGTKILGDSGQIQAEIHIEKSVTERDSTIDGYFSSTMNRESSVNLNQRSSLLQMLKKELKVSRDLMTDILKEDKKDEANVRYIRMMKEQYGIVERHEALLLRSTELAFSKLSKQKAEKDRSGRSMMSSGYIEMEQWQERESFKP
ncbi:hypothetical protein CHS0354_001410 [Potamilus streckersoni]|uniref:Uncharacterized protein n=1 Tax=Potamilus streckersoni TaxID=2493646 RepID=A0AAE0T7W1_9BIVA|nr:hypothetical protein CHS0354_001410 [Potamilus streckersoni]